MGSQFRIFSEEDFDDWNKALGWAIRVMDTELANATDRKIEIQENMHPSHEGDEASGSCWQAMAAGTLDYDNGIAPDAHLA